MSTFWLKIAALAVVIVGLIILVNKFTNSKSEPKPKPKTFYDQAEEDRQRFLAEPEAVDSQEEKPVSETTSGNRHPVTTPELSETTSGPRRAAQNKTAAEHVGAAKEPPEKAEPVKLYFKELSEIDKIEAERFLNVAVPGRSIGRLPMTGFKLMVDSCRQIIRRWPDSWYAYRAKQLLADMPPRFQKRYRVTKEEKSLSRFAKPREGTKPFIIKESR